MAHSEHFELPTLFYSLSLVQDTSSPVFSWMYPTGSIPVHHVFRFRGQVSSFEIECTRRSDPSTCFLDRIWNRFPVDDGHDQQSAFFKALLLLPLQRSPNSRCHGSGQIAIFAASAEQTVLANQCMKL